MMAYITTAELKEYLGIDGAGDDSLLDSMITHVQGIIDDYCNRAFEASDTTRYFDAIRDTNGNVLYLDRDLASITTVTNGDGAALNATTHYVTLDQSPPYWGLRLRTNAGTTWTYTTDPERAIAIAGKWAYSATAPAAIKHAARRLAGYIYHQKDNAGELDRAVIAGNATIMPVQLPADIRLILAPYRKITK